VRKATVVESGFGFIQHQLRRYDHITEAVLRWQDTDPLQTVNEWHADADMQSAIQKNKYTHRTNVFIASATRSSVKCKSRVELTAEKPESVFTQPPRCKCSSPFGGRI
jgi:hypothetical protein